MFTPYGPNRFLITSAPAGNPDLFPLLPGQGFFVSKGPKWSTGVQTAVSGKERTLAYWTYPRWAFKVAYEVIRNKPSLQELQPLWAFFNLHQGRYAVWQFFDPTDNAVTGQPFGTGDGVTTEFQLVRAMYYEGRGWQEPVRSTVGTPVISVNGTPTTAFTLGDDGLITMNSAPANDAVLTWSGQFYFVCRFDQDDLTPAQAFNSLWSLDGLEFVSKK